MKTTKDDDSSFKRQVVFEVLSGKGKVRMHYEIGGKSTILIG